MFTKKIVLNYFLAYLKCPKFLGEVFLFYFIFSIYGHDTNTICPWDTRTTLSNSLKLIQCIYLHELLVTAIGWVVVLFRYLNEIHSPKFGSHL